MWKTFLQSSYSTYCFETISSVTARMKISRSKDYSSLENIVLKSRVSK